MIYSGSFQFVILMTCCVKISASVSACFHLLLNNVNVSSCANLLQKVFFVVVVVFVALVDLFL